MAKTEQQHQSEVTRAGRRFQEEIYRVVAEAITDPNLIVANFRIKQTHPEVYNSLQLHTPIGSGHVDADIIIFDRRKSLPVVIISCKTSLHGRITESLYSAHIYRDMYRRLKFFLVTKDNSRRSEWGSEAKAPQPRILAAHENIFVYSTNPKTSLGGYIKSIDDLIRDIKRCVQ